MIRCPSWLQNQPVPRPIGVFTTTMAGPNSSASAWALLMGRVAVRYTAFIERLEEELGFEFIQIYGLTETAPLLTVQTPDFGTRREDWGRRARAGVPGLGVEIMIADEQGEPVPKDGSTLGEICARSNVVFKGYWEQPGETRKAIRNGWFHTGDLGVWDEVGNVHIADRKKDVIISGGENISSPEIEDALYQHPAVLECAVIGVPHEKWGETPCAIVVPRAGHSPEPAHSGSRRRR